MLRSRDSWRRGMRPWTKRSPKGSKAESVALPRERARTPERERTRNKNIKMFGHVPVYQCEHVRVIRSKVRAQLDYASLAQPAWSSPPFNYIAVDIKV